MKNIKIAVVGLGYVGLPLVVEFGKTFETIGFDVSDEKVSRCLAFIDPSSELSPLQMKGATNASYSTDPICLSNADIIIVAVPTPIDAAHNPDLSPLISATATVGQNMKRGAVVVFESTVYPGVTEDVCIPILEAESKMKWRKDFFVGYSPERINPGDQKHTLTKVIKIVSGDTPLTLDTISNLYETIVEPGVFRASSIKTAEAAKVIENTQRDLNIALMNELAIIFDRIGLDTSEVLEAAGTKWNFMKFQPGLVGGHCIGVDPYYLTHKAEMVGYHPQIILAGRRINDGMGKFIAEQTIKKMIACGIGIKGARINVLGLAFKENCSDIRNSKVVDVINELKAYGVDIAVSDLRVNSAEVDKEYCLKLKPFKSLPVADALIVAVAHDEYKKLDPFQLNNILKKGGVVIDVKGCLHKISLINAGYHFWRP